MGRELKRVPLDFDWPVGETWRGYLNPYHVATKCEACDGKGNSPEAQRLYDLWYGHLPFKPQDRDSTPFLPTDEPVRAFAKRNVEHSPSFYGSGEEAIEREARRLCAHWNGAWCHHLNADDVAALIEADRLWDFTRTWSAEKKWQPKVPACIPTPREVNIWSIVRFGHDSINSWACVKAECKRLGVSHLCAACDGEAELWPSKAAKALYDDWKAVEPPKGDGYQIWETVSEGSAISPVFATPEELARHMVTTRWGADDGTPYETWLAFIKGPGWAPSMIATASGVVEGVKGTVEVVR